MTSPRDTSLVEEEGVDVDGANWDGAEREGGAAESDCRDLKCTLLCLTVAAFMAHMTEKMIKRGKMNRKMA